MNLLFILAMATQWMQITEEFNSNISSSIFREQLPELSEQLDQLRSQPEWLDLWGTSVNFDDIVKQQIVSPSILAVLSEIVNVDPPSDRYHAGLMHTYGYLFSNVKTPYGYKRERWTTNQITAALGLSDTIWGPYPSCGHFFANVSYLAASIAFGDNWQTRVPDLSLASEDLQNYDYTQLAITTIKETISFDTFTLTLKTDLVKFPTPLISGETDLLVYSLKDSRAIHPVLITLFPIAQTYAAWLPSQLMGEVDNIKIQYNAYIPEPHPLLNNGTRQINFH